jgi:hypothetical protein
MNANITLQAATIDDCRAVAELFRSASDGVSDYIWSTLTDQYPGLSLKRGFNELSLLCFE